MFGEGVRRVGSGRAVLRCVALCPVGDEALPDDDEHAPEADAEAEPEAEPEAGAKPASAPLPPPLPGIPPAALPLRASAVDDAPAAQQCLPHHRAQVSRQFEATFPKGLKKRGLDPYDLAAAPGNNQARSDANLVSQMLARSGISGLAQKLLHIVERNTNCLLTPLSNPPCTLSAEGGYLALQGSGTRFSSVITNK